jgi:hypothetical protein
VLLGCHFVPLSGLYDFLTHYLRGQNRSVQFCSL